MRAHVAFVTVGLFTTLTAGVLFAGEDAPEVSLIVKKTETKKMPIGIGKFSGAANAEWLGSYIAEVINADLRRSLLFEPVDIPRIDLHGWKSEKDKEVILKKALGGGLTAVVWGRANMIKHGVGEEIFLDSYYYDGDTDEPIHGKRYIGDSKVSRLIAHRFVDEVVFRLTGEKGISHTKIAFVHKIDGAGQLYVMDYDGYDIRQVTADTDSKVNVKWSHDGQSLVFAVKAANGQQDIQLVKLSTGQRSSLISDGACNDSASMSPDGNILLWSSSRGGNAQIYTMHGDKVAKLTNNNAENVEPTWSHDGKEIAFTSNRGGNMQVYVMTYNGERVRLLSPVGTHNSSPAWSPTGSRIAYVCRNKLGKGKICVVQPDGRRFVQLTDDDGSDDASPSWSPDGRHILYSSTVNGTENLYMINSDGGDKERVPFDNFQAEMPSWSPY